VDQGVGEVLGVVGLTSHWRGRDGLGKRGKKKTKNTWKERRLRAKERLGDPDAKMGIVGGNKLSKPRE